MKKFNFINYTKAAICAFILFSLQLNALAQYSIVVNGPSEICGSNNTYLSLSPSGGTAFNWHKFNIPFGGTFSTTNTLQSPETGYWVCEVTTGSGIITTPPVLIRTNLVYIESVLGNSSCSGSLTLDENASAVANLALYNSYQWKKNGVNITTSALGFTYNATSSGTYTCEVVLGCGTGLSNPLNITIDSPIPSNTVITAQSSTTICAGSSVTLSVPQNASWTYLWKKNNVALSGGFLNAILATQAGSYTCVITNTCGSFTTAAKTVSVTPLPVAATITANGPTSFCIGGNVTLSGNTLGGTWSGPITSTAPSIVTNSNGDYFVITSNTCGITESNHILVTVNPNPVVSFSGLASTYNCMDAPVTLIGSPLGGTYTGAGISGNIFNPSIVGTGGGTTITYNYSNSAGCSGSYSSLVMVSSAYNCVIPQNVSVSQIAKKTAVISWNSSAAPSFKVRYRKTGSTTYLYKNITWTPCSATSVQLNGLISNTNYTVDVKTVCTTGANTYSQSITFKTLATNPVPITTNTREITLAEMPVEEPTSIQIFPNPFENTITLRTTEIELNTSIEITDLSGRIVQKIQTESTQDEIKINTSDWQAGIYFVRFRNNEQLENYKLIKH